MIDHRDTYLGLPPTTAVERAQAAAEGRLADEDARAARARLAEATPRPSRVAPPNSPAYWYDPAQCPYRYDHGALERWKEHQRSWSVLTEIQQPPSAETLAARYLDPDWIRRAVLRSRPPWPQMPDEELEQIVALTLFARRFERWVEEGLAITKG